MYFLKLPNYLFEEMALDAYDEVDRRETEQCMFHISHIHILTGIFFSIFIYN